MPQVIPRDLPDRPLSRIEPKGESPLPPDRITGHRLRGGEDAFVVLRDAMKDKGRVAIARVVFGNREHIVAIESWSKGMLCTTLRYDYEVRPEAEVFRGMPLPRVSREMIDLASHILESKADKFAPSEFKDEYDLALRKLVKQKSSGKTIERSEPAEERSNVIDLMAALRQSVGGRPDAPKKRASSKKSPRKRAS